MARWKVVSGIDGRSGYAFKINIGVLRDPEG